MLTWQTICIAVTFKAYMASIIVKMPRHEQTPKIKESKIKSTKDRIRKYNSLLFSFIFLQSKHTQTSKIFYWNVKTKSMKWKTSGWSRSFDLVGGIQSLGILVDGATMAEDLNFGIWGFQLKKKNRNMD